MNKASLNIHLDQHDLKYMLSQFNHSDLIDILCGLDKNIADVDFSVDLLCSLMKILENETVNRSRKKKLKNSFDSLYKSVKMEK